MLRYYNELKESDFLETNVDACEEIASFEIAIKKFGEKYLPKQKNITIDTYLDKTGKMERVFKNFL